VICRGFLLSGVACCLTQAVRKKGLRSIDRVTVELNAPGVQLGSGRGNPLLVLVRHIPSNGCRPGERNGSEANGSMRN